MKSEKKKVGKRKQTKTMDKREEAQSRGISLFKEATPESKRSKTR